GHNILIDLDTLSLRRWWVGDFASQHVRGKKWYWETAGLTLFDQPSSPSLLDIKPPPTNSGETLGWLEWYEHTADGVRIGYRLKEQKAAVEMTISATEHGWSLRVLVSRPIINIRKLTLPKELGLSFQELTSGGGMGALLHVRTEVEPRREKTPVVRSPQ